MVSPLELALASPTFRFLLETLGIVSLILLWALPSSYAPNGGARRRIPLRLQLCINIALGGAIFGYALLQQDLNDRHLAVYSLRCSSNLRVLQSGTFIYQRTRTRPAAASGSLNCFRELAARDDPLEKRLRCALGVDESVELSEESMSYVYAFPSTKGWPGQAIFAYCRHDHAVPWETGERMAVLGDGTVLHLTTDDLRGRLSQQGANAELATMVDTSNPFVELSLKIGFGLFLVFNVGTAASGVTAALRSSRGVPRDTPQPGETSQRW